MTLQKGGSMPKKQIMWAPKLKKNNTPVYVQIAAAIADDIVTGRLVAEQRLPPQRKLAEQLGIDFTTVARAYTEAQRRGLVDSQVGRGTFVCGRRRPAIPRVVEGRPNIDLSMNMPPEPESAEITLLMQAGYAEVGKRMRDMLRYQDFCGSADDREAGALWLRRRGLVVGAERILVTAGAQCALLAVLTTLAPPGSVICCEELTYPGLRALAGHLGLRLVGLPMDSEGIDAVAFAAACAQYAPKALYCNPTLLNPTTATMSAQRREALVEVARFHGVAIIEDDAYGFLPRSGPPAMASIGPDITFYIAGLAKCVGAGLRVAYMVAPDAHYATRLAGAIRATTVMVSPFTAALATRWIRDGTADLILNSIRKECAVRQKIAARALPTGSYESQPESFHLWIRLPPPWTRQQFVARLQACGIGVVTSDSFWVSAQPPEAVRVCIGGVATRDDIQHALEQIASSLRTGPTTAPAVV
jgi:DNA-binding transcriptional MocR family regulator